MAARASVSDCWPVLSLCFLPLTFTLPLLRPPIYVDNTGPCRWFLGDGVTSDPNTDQDYIESCADCQSGCQGASDCIRWSFDGSDVAYFSDASVCGPWSEFG